jgi:hypothetical protein
VPRSSPHTRLSEACAVPIPILDISSHLFQVHLPVEIWQEIIKYLGKPELHAISQASAILRNTSLSFLFHTVRFGAKDRTGLRDLADAYAHKRAVCKNIAKLHLDYKQASTTSRGKFWAFIEVRWAVAVIFTGISRSQMPRLTTLVLHETPLFETWVHSILKSQTLRRLHLHACWCSKWTKPFPPTKVSELVIQDVYHSRDLDALAIFLAPQLEVLEVHGKLFGFTLRNESLLALFPKTCPRLRKYVLRRPNGGKGYLVKHLREFLIRTTTIEDLELGLKFTRATLPLPSSALPNLRLYDVTLWDGFPATRFITGPRRKLCTLRIRDDFVKFHNRATIPHFLHLLYEVSELHLDFPQRYNIAKLFPAQLDGGFPNIENLYLNMRANHLCSLPPDVPDPCPNCSVLGWTLARVSQFINSMKAAYPVQENKHDCSRRLGLHELKTISVDIDVDSCGTSPWSLETWFHSMVKVNCPVLEEAYFRVWKANHGEEENRAGVRPRFWDRWRMGMDGHWCYEYG